MSAFLRKNPRLEAVARSDESLAPSVNKSASLTPGLFPATFGAAANICSTGIPSLNAVLGGGLPAGTVLTVHEDVPASKANFCWSGPVRCFLAECIATSEEDWTRKNGGWMAVVGHDISGLLKTLPKATTEPTSSEQLKTALSNDMKIAWRYQGMKEFDSSLQKIDVSLSSGQLIGHSFDLGRKHTDIPKQMGERTFQLELDNYDGPCSYKHCWTFLETLIRTNQRFGLGRIVIGSLGAPGFWRCSCEKTCGPTWLMQKLTNLLQETETSHPCVCLVTLPSVFLNNPLITSCQKQSTSTLPAWIAAVENISDAVLELKPVDSLSFKSEPKSTLSREFDGFLIVKKPLRRPNSLQPFLPETQNLVFKIRRRRFIIEKFHLPPALENAPASSLCGSSPGTGAPHPLDF